MSKRLLQLYRWAQQFPPRHFADCKYLTAEFHVEDEQSLPQRLNGYSFIEPKISEPRNLIALIVQWVYRQPETVYLRSGLGSINSEIQTFLELSLQLSHSAEGTRLYSHPEYPPLLVLKEPDGYLVMKPTKKPHATFT